MTFLRLPFSRSLLLPFAFLAALPRASACDLCSCYSEDDVFGLSHPGWSFSAATQFTHFGTLRDEGHRVPDPAGQWLDSAITQVVAAYRFNDRFTAQLNAPLIDRSFRRPAGFAIDRGHESGLGDASLLGRWTALREEAENFSFGLNLLAGLKFPTGSARRIAEEFSETEIPGAPVSGVHGHDLTLGSGSTDALFGTQMYFRSGRAFVTAALHYTARRTGRYDYRFANDLTWEAAPGLRLDLAPDRTLAVQAVVSGEHKGTDTFAGDRADDTGITAVYAGPRLTYTQAARFNAELGMDFPVRIDNTAIQLTADYKLRASVTWGF
jgi:hypothetical protein